MDTCHHIFHPSAAYVYKHKLTNIKNLQIKASFTPRTTQNSSAEMTFDTNIVFIIFPYFVSKNTILTKQSTNIVNFHISCSHKSANNLAVRPFSELFSMFNDTYSTAVVFFSRKPTNWWGSAKRDATQPTATFV